MQRIENLHMLKLASNLFYVEPISFALALRWLVFFGGGKSVLLQRILMIEEN